MRTHQCWSIAVLLLLLAACSAVPENHYFTMSYVLLPRKDVHTFPVMLHIRQLEIMPAYDQDRLVYRYSPYEFSYYNYMLWAAKPQKMITNMLIRHVAHADLFEDVSSEYSERRPDYELYGTIDALEELDSGDEWYAHLAFTLRLTRFRGEKVLWSHRVDAKKQVYNKEPVYVVKALSELMEAEMDRIITSLGAFLKDRPPEEGRP
jgi:ABC-type uncharacterized transport system auxiliary subunit